VRMLLSRFFGTLLLFFWIYLFDTFDQRYIFKVVSGSSFSGRALLTDGGAPERTRSVVRVCQRNCQRVPIRVKGVMVVFTGYIRAARGVCPMG